MTTHPLLAARQARGWSRATLGAKAGVHHNTIQRIEEGKRKTVKIETAQGICRALGVPVLELFPELDPEGGV